MTTTRTPEEMLSIVSVQSCAGEDASVSIPEQPVPMQSNSAVCSAGSLAVPFPRGHAYAASDVGCVGDDGVDGEEVTRMGLEGNKVVFKREELPALRMSIPSLALPPQLHPIIVTNAPLEHGPGVGVHSVGISGGELSQRMKVCIHCGVATDGVKANKCQHCHNSPLEHRTRLSPCPKSRPSEKCVVHDKDSCQCKPCGNFVASEGGAVFVGSVDPKVAVQTGDARRAGSDCGSSLSKGDCLAGESDSGEHESMSRSNLVVSSARATPTSSTSSELSQEQETSAATHKPYKYAATVSDQPPSGGIAVAVETSSSSAMPSTLPSLASAGFVLPLLHTTTVGAALLNISNSSLTNTSLESRFAPPLHPLTVIDLTSQCQAPSLAPACDTNPASSVSSSAKLNPLSSQLPVMMNISGTATIGDALNYVMTRTPQGSAIPPLVPATSTSPPASAAIPCPQPPCIEPPALVSNTIAAFSSQSFSTSPEGGCQMEVTGSSAGAQAFESEKLVHLPVHSSSESGAAFGRSEPVVVSAHPTFTAAPVAMDRTSPMVLSGDGAVSLSEASSRPSPPHPSVHHPQSDPTEGVGSKVTLSSVPPLLVKDSGNIAPPTTDVVGGAGNGDGGKTGESSHFFSNKFRTRYGHLERGDGGKGLKRTSNPDSTSALKKMKGADSPPAVPIDPAGGVPFSHLVQPSGAAIKTEVPGMLSSRHVVAPVTTQFQRQVGSSRPTVTNYQKVVSSSAPVVSPVQGSVSMSLGKVPPRLAETVRPTPIRPHPSPLHTLQLQLQSQQHSQSIQTSNVSMATHGIHTATPSAGLLPIPPLVKTSTVITSQSSSVSSTSSSCSLVNSSNSLLNPSSIIQNVLLRPALASTAVMGNVTAQLLKPQSEAKPGTTVVRVLSPTPSLTSGLQPARNKVSATTVFPTIAITSLASLLPTTAKSTLVEPKATILSQSGRESGAVTGGTSARTSPPLISPGGARAKVVYTSTITGPRSSPGGIEGGGDGVLVKVGSGSKVPLPVAPSASDLQQLTCTIQSRIKQVLDKEPEGSISGGQEKGVSCSPLTPTAVPSRPLFTTVPPQLPSRVMESVCTSTWVPPVGCPPSLVGSAPPTLGPPSIIASDRVVQTLSAVCEKGLQSERATSNGGQTVSDRGVQSILSEVRVSSSPIERPVTTASVATFTERSVGTSTERSVGTSTERSIGTSTERSVGTSTERSVGTSTERSVASYERVVSPLDRGAPGSFERGVVTPGEKASAFVSERSANERPVHSSTPTAPANQGLPWMKEEYRADMNGIAVSMEADTERNGEKYSKLRSDEALESGSEETSENGNVNNDSIDTETQVFSVKLKDCFMHHVMWHSFKMVFLVPQLNDSRAMVSDVKAEDAKADEGGKRKTRKQERGVYRGEEEEDEDSYMECVDSKEASPSSSQSGGVPVTPCFSVYELRTKLFSSFSPSAVYVYTYKNNIRSYKPPIHWVYVMKRMGGVQDTCHTCRLLGMQHVKNICDYYRIKLPSILDALGRNEIPAGRKVIDLSHIGTEELDQEHLDLIPSCAFVDTPTKGQTKLPRKRGRKYIHGESSPPTPSEQSESVDNSMDHCDGYDGNNSTNRFLSTGKKKPCPQCGTNILKKCKKCPLCGKTFGLFAFGRRQCTSCGRVNLAKYTNCNKCGANLQNAPIALPKDEETRESPQPVSEYVCKRRRLHNLPVTYSSHDHEDGEAPLGGSRLSRHTSGASDADEEMADYGEEFDEEEDCPDDSEISSAKSPTKSRHAGYQYGRVPWANTEVAVLVDEKGVLRFCLHELCTRVLTEHSKADVFNMVKDLNLPMEQGDISLLKKLQALGMHSNRSPICRLIAAEDLWALLDALQEPVPDEVHQHLETVTLTAPHNNNYPSSPVPAPVNRPSQLNVSQSPDSANTPQVPPVQESPALILNPGTTPVIAEDESGFESTLHEMQCSDGQFVSILRAWNGGQYVCLPEVWRKYFPEVNRNNLTGVLKKLELDTHLPTGQQATLLRSAGVISLRGAPGRLMKLEDMQSLLDSFGIPLQIGSGKALTPAKQVSHQTTPKPRPINAAAPKPVAIRVCDERPAPVQKDSVSNTGDLRLAQCMQNILIALGSEDIEKLLKECAQSMTEASSLAEQEANGVAGELDGVEQLVTARRELCQVLNKEIGYLRATSHGYMAEIVRLNSVQRQAFQDIEDHLFSVGIMPNSLDTIHNS